ncbi:MAG: tol-pal system-associated acyl-CoA thioesterase [Gammaproteobacteria bacterium]|nr:tol-pal system-associated acyl-CoA thioesterase [Gammaproteobacteria bacterium]
MSGGWSSDEFRLPLRVYIEDTDAGGIVYYVNYLKYFERARTELMRSHGFARPALPEAGLMFVVNSLQVDYLSPARLDDELMACARLCGGGRARLLFAQRILRAGQDICRAEVSVACVSPATGKPCALPARMRAVLNAIGPGTQTD